MIRKINLLTLFAAVSTVALLCMKAILWTLFQWGAKVALPIALLLFAIYVWSFYFAKSIESINFSNSSLAWIWTFGFIEIAFLGGLYHFTPQYFPSFAGDFFFN